MDIVMIAIIEFLLFKSGCMLLKLFSFGKINIDTSKIQYWQAMLICCISVLFWLSLGWLIYKLIISFV